MAKQRRTTTYKLAQLAWRRGQHNVVRATKHLIAFLCARPSLHQHIIEQYAAHMIGEVMNGTRDATLEPQSEKQVKGHILTPSITRTPLGPSGIRTGTLIDRDVLDYPIQFLNKSLGDATPEEVEKALDRYAAEARRRLRIDTGIRAIIKGLPKRKVPVRKQITSVAARAIAKRYNIYKDLIV